jgi:hypothetical protein
MKYTIYIKKERTEANMPKESGEYIACIADRIHPVVFQKEILNKFPLYWQDIEWYLQPIELDLPDDEEIVKQFPYAYDDLDIQNSIQWLRDKIKNQLEQ